MKKKKIKWLNVIKLLLMLFCIGVILHDFYYLVIGYGFTWLGFGTHILCWLFVSMIYDDFEEQIKNIPSYKPRHARDIK